MTKAKRAEKDEAIQQLREWIKPGDTVYTVLEHVSRSGMQREIRVVVPYVKDPQDVYYGERNVVDFLHPNHAIATALGMRQGKRDGLIVGGCGMDMGFHVVYELSHTLYGSLRCEACGKYPSGEYRTVIEAEYKTGNPKLHPSCEYCGAALVGGYPCLGKGQCPSNYHVNHRDRIRCEGHEGRFCYKPSPWGGRYEIPTDWPRAHGKTVELDPDDPELEQTRTVFVPGPYLACLSGSGEDGQPYEVCPTCKGVGDLPNPEGPERFDLLHTDGYALRHKWL